MHLRDAWNHTHPAEGDEGRLERRPIVLTVPASFDEEARELTVQAARAAGFERLTLLEEPLAALYAWMAANRRSLDAMFAAGALILVCDVGGGTTDFSLIRVTVEDGAPAFERIAIGEHLLLGGDNLDLALAVRVEQKFGAGREADSGAAADAAPEVQRREGAPARRPVAAPASPSRCSAAAAASSAAA